jgi:hypothetical protein
MDVEADDLQALTEGQTTLKNHERRLAALES